MRKTPVRRSMAVAVAAAVAALTGAAGLSVPAGAADRGPDNRPADRAQSAAQKAPPLKVQLLALNDFHGNLEPPTGSGGRIQVGVDEHGDPVNVDAGGAAYLDTVLKRLRRQGDANTITVAAGDLIGASPLLSAAFHDEPAIESLGLAGLDYASVGNHEFDEGADELLRIQHGGCHPADGCFGEEEWQGADFEYLSANAFVTETGEPLLAPYAIHKVGGQRIGFIGMTLEGTKDIVSQAGVAGLEFHDEAETANRYAAELQEQGVEAIVVLLHEGGRQNGANAWDVNGCNNLTGPITEIAPNMSDAIDVVVSGHTHQAYNCEIDGKLVTSASSAGRLVTDIDLTIDRVTGDVIRAAAENVVVERNRAAAGQLDLIAHYRELLGPIASRVVGETAEVLDRKRETLYEVTVDGKTTVVGGESELGKVIADAQLWDTQGENAVAAFMNPGGVRADLDEGPVTYEEAFSVQPFANNLVTMDLTGQQLYCMLEQGFSEEERTGSTRVLYPSSTVTYQVDPSGATAASGAPCSGTRVVDGSLTINGETVDRNDGTTTYRVTVNNFLAGGGDGYSVLRGGTNVVTGSIDLDALTAYLGAQEEPISAPADDRITVLEAASERPAA